MKVCELTETYAEFLPRDDKRQSAEDIARQFIRNAQYKSGGKPKGTRELAHKMAARFHSSILDAIDNEMKFSQMKNVNARV